jgi:uncharacterized protein (DUF433 family)
MSFVNLIEAHVLWSLRKVHGMSLQRIRSSVPWLRKNTGRQHPLAELDLMTDGRSIFIELLKQFCNATEQGQVEMDSIVAPYLKRIERDPQSNMPVRFFPLTRLHQGSPSVIVIDPAVAFGRPVIVGTRISTAFILERYLAGETVSGLAADYSVDPGQIDEAIRCEFECSRAA